MLDSIWTGRARTPQRTAEKTAHMPLFGAQSPVLEPQLLDIL